MKAAKPRELTDPACKNAKPLAKPYKLHDVRGLFLLVNPNGAKWWRLRYTLGGKDGLLSLGVYPDAGLKEARTGRDDARKLIAAGINPSQHRQAEKARQQGAATDSFEAIAREWFAKNLPSWVESHSSKIQRRLEVDIFPWLGKRPMRGITPQEVLATLRRIESRGALETSHRARQDMSLIYRYAIACGRADRDPAADVRGALPPAKGKHYPTITEPRAVGELMRAIRGATGAFPTVCALRLAPLVFVRPGELRAAEWAEINLEAAEWRIPATKMKMRAPHIVPLSVQAVAILRELEPLTGSGRYCFPGERSRSQCMSEATINATLRRMGYTKEQMTGHGFRAMASTMLHEQGWLHEAIERQLAHAKRDQVSAAYNHAEHLPLRRTMVQHWADYLDSLARGESKVVALRVA